MTQNEMTNQQSIIKGSLASGGQNFLLKAIAIATLEVAKQLSRIADAKQ